MKAGDSSDQTCAEPLRHRDCSRCTTRPFEPGSPPIFLSVSVTVATRPSHTPPHSRRPGIGCSNM